MLGNQHLFLPFKFCFIFKAFNFFFYNSLNSWICSKIFNLKKKKTSFTSLSSWLCKKMNCYKKKKKNQANIDILRLQACDKRNW